MGMFTENEQGVKLDWSSEVRRFQALVKFTGQNKSSSYNVNIQFDRYDGIRVYMGTYDVADWPRHTNLGPFATEELAFEAFKQKVDDAEKDVIKEHQELKDYSYGKIS